MLEDSGFCFCKAEDAPLGTVSCAVAFAADTAATGRSGRRDRAAATGAFLKPLITFSSTGTLKSKLLSCREAVILQNRCARPVSFAAAMYKKQYTGSSSMVGVF